MELDGNDMTDDLVHEVVRRAERGERTNLSRGGHLVAVVLGIDEYDALTRKLEIA